MIIPGTLSGFVRLMNVMIKLTVDNAVFPIDRIGEEFSYHVCSLLIAVQVIAGPNPDNSLAVFQDLWGKIV